LRLRLPQAVDVYERGVSLNVMSKAYGLPGLRIGWLACRDRATLVRFEHYKHFLSICNSAPSEVLARIALKARDKILDRTRKIVRDNMTVLNGFFADYAHLFDWREPDGGCVGLIRYKGAEGVEEFTRRNSAPYPRTAYGSGSGACTFQPASRRCASGSS
jgi:aspartate/methionine/tyrosine aminotransferase